MQRALIVLVLLLLGCGDGLVRRARFPAPTGSATGSITLVFSQKATDVVVALNGTLVVRGVETETLRIDGVESGYVDVAVAAAGIEKQLRIWVDADRNTAVPITASAPKGPNPILMTALSVAALLVSRAATDWLF